MTESSAMVGRTETPVALLRMLRVGVALCFLGHGAFGLMTKAAWVPYFAAAGVPEAWAWRFMPWIGALDVTVAGLALLWPCRALFAWAAVWATWTALLRPLAGQGWPEFFERAGNYGVPLAVLVIVGLRGPWFSRLPAVWPEISTAVHRRLTQVLQLALASLLAGHAACALVLQKPVLAHHYEVLGSSDPARVMLAVGWFEAGLAFAVLVVRAPALLVFACLWKLATESLFLTSGAPAPVFEIIERGGSYIVPLTLAYLLTRSTAVAPSRYLQPA